MVPRPHSAHSALFLLVLLLVSLAIATPIVERAARANSTVAASNGASQTAFKVQVQVDPEQDNKVPIRLAVMSKCPDAELCESVFDRVLDKVGTLVDIKLLYIGDTEYGKVKCKHGPSECTGNIQQLCAEKYWQGVDGSVNPWATWWNFVQCQNYNGLPRIGTDRLAQSCASVVGKTWSGDVEECANSSEGTQLLRDSFKATKALQLVKSCSIVIDGKLVCVRDGRWIDCEEGHEVGDFVNLVNKAWKRLNEREESSGSALEGTF
ncbi:BZ3500_MvSof-1268-A1-R1_Chr5-1g07626 [Microbotryum saponariae]|uniref:BZ3500_MvSof-1268-A1-R1_Chr5-1g07626 protein n=1 Tax=Microbotryum saponariae TaxID=289078 RepID=A0A2X0NJE0_9BASI|nr:BZ3500_MvSof-1268-A1-R1_Chr5-1g07626 [Microbotryum saponariae]SDA05497.1 BZ3501_MvSof-1269-A2-R1_Chr5-2g07450 [Microbotryum saponariae]